MSDEMTDGSDAAQKPNLPFIEMASGAGIELILDSSLSPEEKLPWLRQIFMDIRKQVSDDEPDNEPEEGVKPEWVYCSQCSILYPVNSQNYINCLKTCHPG